MTAASVLQVAQMVVRLGASPIRWGLIWTASVLDKDGDTIVECALALTPRRSENLQIQKPLLHSQLAASCGVGVNKHLQTALAVGNRIPSSAVKCI